MRGATVFMYWTLTILFVLAALAVPACLVMLVWSGDGRWGWTSLITGVTSFIFVCLAATIEESG